MPKRKTKYYNIHNIIKVACNIEHFPKHLEVGEVDYKDLDIIVELGDFEFDKSGCERFGAYLRKGKELYLEYRVPGFRKQKILISDLFGKAKLKVLRMTHKNFDVEQFVHLMASIKLLQKGCAFVHSAAVAKDGRGLLITAWSEMGKSSTLFGLSKNYDFGLMGDDTVILSKDGVIYSYPVVAGVFFHSENVKNLKFTPMEKLKLMIKYIVAKLPPLYLYMSPNLLIELENIGHIIDEAKLEKTYFLGWGEGKEKLDKDTSIKKIMSTTIHGHDRYFAKDAFLAYCYLNDYDPDFVEKNLKGVLESAIGECSIIRCREKKFHKMIWEEFERS